ncbi:MAG TPA: S1-like domain-containing RNA-binding protein [Polyangiaceae bacterium]|nr:S1-like domain-containing RNA-binding protein [Polyangiaceae bacterium]
MPHSLLDLIGRTSLLTIKRKTDLGYVLDVAQTEVLLPLRNAAQSYSAGQSIEAFVYTDTADRLVATTQRPLAQVGDFACLSVVDRNAHGAFLNWGLDKDLFCPNSEQHLPLQIGQSYVVAVYLDNRTSRVAAATRLAEFLDYDVSHLSVGDEVELLVFGSTPRGTQVIVNERHSGMLFHDHTFVPLDVGQRVRGYVEQIRNDNKLDVTLRSPGQPHGKEKRTSDQQLVLDALNKAGGTLDIGDQSAPQAVYQALGMSKKAFKAAVGQLYRRGLVSPGPDQVRLGQGAPEQGSAGAKDKRK